MPLFPRFVSHNPSASYNDIRPLLQAILDPSYYDQSPTHASSRSPQQSPQRTSGNGKAFSPAFDVKETEHAYILEGELPGLFDKKAVDIEFTDHQTLLVKGRVEKSAHHHSGETNQEGQKQITSSGEEAHPKRPHTPPKPTVEDDIDEDDRASSIKMTPTSSINTVLTNTTNTTAKQDAASKKEQQSKIRYWVSERSVGAFQRSFSFPGLIDQDAVTANLKNGVLTIVIPKKTMNVTRKIEVQ